MAQKRIYRMRDLGKLGIVNDIPSYDLQPNTWSSGNNVRFEAGRVQKIGGWIPTVAEPTGVNGIHSGMPDELPLAIAQKPLTKAVIYGTKNKLWLAAGLEHTDVSGGMTFHCDADHRWEYTNLSNVLVFNNRSDDPVGFVPGAANTAFAPLPGWGHDEAGSRDSTSGEWKFDASKKKPWSTEVIRAYKNYLVALGTTEDGHEYPQRVRWSDVALPNQLPENWSAQDKASVAGFNDLSNSMGTIIDGLALRDSLIIYTDEDTYAMDLVGGDFKFNFRKIFPDSGILAKGCVTEFEGKHFVISQNDIFVHDGSTQTPVAASRVKDFLMKEVTSTNYFATRCYTNTAHKEIWITYVGAGQTRPVDASGHPQGGIEVEWACNKVAIWNWQYDTWTYADLPGVFDITMAYPPDTDKRQWNGYVGDRSKPTSKDDEWGSSWRDLETWSNFNKTFSGRQLIAPTLQKCLMILDVGYYQTKVHYDRANADVLKHYSTTQTPVLCSIERTGLDFDEQEADISYNKMIRTIYPQMGGKGNVLFSIGGSDSPTASPTWESKQYFEIGKDHKVDCWSNHRYISIRVEDSFEGDWNFTGFDVDYVTEGNR